MGLLAFDELHQLHSAGRLVAYDVFYGLGGSLWVISPSFATLWDAPDDWGTWQIGVPSWQSPPVPLLATEDRAGYVKRLVVEVGGDVLEPKVWHDALQPVLWQFDLPVFASEVTVAIEVAGGWERHELSLAPPPAERVFCAAATESVSEQKTVQEWIDHCRTVGVGHFYLYDNHPHSQDGYVFADADVTVLPWCYPWMWRMPMEYATADRWRFGGGDHGLGCQLAQMQHAIYKYGPLCDWLALIDDDEYPNLLEAPDLQGLLAGDADRAAVTLGSVFYGDRGSAEAAQDAGFAERFVYRQHLDEETAYARRKVLLRAANIRIGERVCIHDFFDRHDIETVFLRTPFERPRWRQVPLEVARLNHYYAARWQTAVLHALWGPPGQTMSDVLDESILRHR